MQTVFFSVKLRKQTTNCQHIFEDPGGFSRDVRQPEPHEFI